MNESFETIPRRLSQIHEPESAGGRKRAFTTFISFLYRQPLSLKTTEMHDVLNAIRTSLEFIRKDLDNEVYETAEWLQVITPGAQTPYMNSILRSLLTEGNVESRIKTTIEEYSARKLPFRWVVSPWSTPASLGEKLCQHGFELRDRTAGLSASAVNFAKVSIKDVLVEQLTKENVEDWIKASIVAWDTPEAGHDLVRRRAEKALAASDYYYFFARFQGEPIAIGNLRVFDGFSFLSSGAVKQQLRGRGIYTALVAHRARFSLELGANLLLTHAVTTTSAPILERMGFHKHCEMEQYFYDPK